MNLLRTVLFLLVLALPFRSFAQTPPATNAPAKRFLFIVETSSEMKKFATATRQSLTELVQVGMGGLMNDGDTFGIWTFNEEISDNRFPMTTWKNENSAEIGKKVDAFLKDQRYTKKPDFEAVLRPMFTVIRSSRTITVVLVTSGTRPMEGTPFDRDINQFYKDNFKDFQKKKVPFLTMLLAQNGRVLRHSVGPAIGDVKIPKPLPPVVNAPKTNAAALKPALPVAKSKDVNNGAKPVEAIRGSQALIITKSGAKTVETNQLDEAKLLSEERETKPIVAVTSTPAPVPVEAPKPLEAPRKPQPVAVTTDAAPVAATTSTPAPATPAPAPVIAAPVTNEVATTKTPEPIVTPAATPAPSTPESAATEPAVVPVVQPPEIKTTVSTPTPPIPTPAPVVPAPVAAPAPPVVAVEPPAPPAPAPTPLPTSSPSAQTTVTPAVPVVEDHVAAPAPEAERSTNTVAAVKPSGIPPADQTPELSQEVAKAAPEPVAKVEPVSASAVPVAATAEPSSNVKFLVAGVGLVLFAIVIAFLLGRQSSKRSGPSIITDSFQRSGK